jgi:hypothetical protein
VATTIYGVLYLIIFGPDIVVPEDPLPFKLLLLLFLVGYLIVWMNEWIGGVIFILWYVAMWGFNLLIITPKYPGFYMGRVLGFPLFVIGILFVVRWYRGRRVEKVSNVP